MKYARVHLIISGRVQGIFFRANTIEKARILGLTGWVRNLPSGKVEVLAEGQEEKIKKLIEWCKRGPPLARVSDVKIKYERYKGQFSSFDKI